MCLLSSFTMRVLWVRQSVLCSNLYCKIKHTFCINSISVYNTHMEICKRGKYIKKRAKSDVWTFQGITEDWPFVQVISVELNRKKKERMEIIVPRSSNVCGFNLEKKNQSAKNCLCAFFHHIKIMHTLEIVGLAVKLYWWWTRARKPFSAIKIPLHN